jgi:hypothetical protein
MGETVQLPLQDALRGALPPVCCMSGARADGLARLAVPKRIGVAWLLLLGGPVGLLVLLALWPKIRVRYEIRIPMSDPVFERMHLVRTRRLWCGWLGAMGVVASFALWWMPVLALAVLSSSLVSLTVAVRSHLVLPWTHPSAIADGRGRTVTLRGVHPAFAAAIAARR